MAESEYTFAFFPYLQTSRPITFKDIKISSSDDPSTLPANAIPHLQKLSKMFFWRDHIRIKKMLFAFQCSDDHLSNSDFTKRLIEFQAMICYFYSSPHPITGDPFFAYENSSLYLLQPKRVYDSLIRGDLNADVLPDARELTFNEWGERDGYEGRLNNRAYFWVTDGSRIFPPTPTIQRNYSQDLAEQMELIGQSEISRPLAEYLFSKRRNDSFGDRILTSITWYNKSLRNDIEESEALVNLAIAFESLLDLDRGDKITDRFKDAVRMIVRDVDRLDSWVHQFYRARSDIVHEGQSSNLMFLATDEPDKAKNPQLFKIRLPSLLR